MLKETFTTLIHHYTSDKNQGSLLWDEVEVNYSKKKRYYHTLEHLENLLSQLSEVKNELQEWDTVLFSLYYHDIVYNPLKGDNEEKSAVLAESRMKALAVPPQIIENCTKQILATKKHLPGADSDTNYFTDADLSVLGQDWDGYETYFKNVRKEYSIYPDLIYIPGRKKVLQHFINMEHIFKTDHFFKKFEAQAKQNLQKELEIL